MSIPRLCQKSSGGHQLPDQCQHQQRGVFCHRDGSRVKLDSEVDVVGG